MRCDATGNPYAGSDHAIVPNNSFTPENRSVGVDNHSILNRWMTFGTSDQLTIDIGRKAESSQRHSLIDLDVFTDFASLADDNARPVVDKKDSPILAPGWISMPVCLCAHSVIILGIKGTAKWTSS